MEGVTGRIAENDHDDGWRLGGKECCEWDVTRFLKPKGDVLVTGIEIESVCEWKQENGKGNER